MHQPDGLGQLRAGDVLVGRYLVVDLLDESRGGRFWRAEDQVLQRAVALHVIPEDDDRADGLLEAARLSATVHDPRILRVLDADRTGGLCFVVNEWGSGASLDILLARDGPISPRRAAWLVGETAAVVAAAHETGVAHGRLAPETVLVDQHGSVRIIGLAVEAALWGLPPGRMSTDVTDLGALLYAALTARWPGVSRSAVPPAHQVTGRVLRPRKVRAGIPKVLDGICDEVLNSPTGGHHVKSPYDLTTARGIADALAEFVGDPTGLAVPEPERVLAPMAPAADDAAGAGPPDGSDDTDDPDPESAAEPERAPAEPTADPDDWDDTGEQDGTVTATVTATGAVAPAAWEETPSTTDQPTQAGMPVFHDGDDVAWISTRAEKPPPPPPFEATPARPLFAPPPPEGAPVRTPRPGVQAAPAQDYWPWDGGDGRSGTGTHPGITSSGSGIVMLDDADEDDTVPGRSWMRLAAVLGASMLLLIAVVFAFNLGQGRSPLQFDDDPQDSPTPSTTTDATAQVVTGTTATDLDPQGGDREENPDLVPLVVDADPATAWRTQTYTQQLGPVGLKTGVGLVVDLGAVVDVRRVRVDLVGTPTDVSLFLTDDAPTMVAGLTPVAQETAAGRLDVPVQASGRYLIVWLTSLPAVDGGFRGSVAEIVVRQAVAG